MDFEYRRPEQQVQTIKMNTGETSFTWTPPLGSRRGSRSIVPIFRPDGTPIEPEVCHSPVFSSTDKLDMDTWQLEFRRDLIRGNNNFTLDEDRVIIRYFGNDQERNSRFAIHFRVVQYVRTGLYRRTLYDDTSVETKSQNFFENRSYEIVIPRRTSESASSVTINCIIHPDPTQELANIEKMSIDPNQHEISLKTEYEHLFESGKYSDITFVINKQKLQMHKSILSTRSVVLAAMFDNNFKEKVCNTVHIEDQSFEVMREFFRYVYCAKVNDIENYMVGLLMTANKYEVEGLKLLCEQSLIKSLKIENAVEFFDLAHRYRAKNLKSHCLKFIVSNAKTIVKLSTFDINQLPSELRNELFKAAIQKIL
ncbi:hypothetical protein QAD02_016619 [Eretmocerus hayati]|uniref:Uncharacterized protein n=1 Tax=Eretmocerus hayati TaxID=131215 RepID=A0ACC2PEG2_9HYME|nr:hypothetical protein QAD02_016619 [Eretmocerus hayati]